MSLKGRIVRTIKESFLFNDLYRMYTEKKIAKKYKNKSINTVFNDIKDGNNWVGEESVSGTGSDTIQTKKIIMEIPKLLNELNSKTLLDVPCGDHFWMNKVNLNGINYIGGDIVSSLIDQNIKSYNSKNKKFLQLNIIENILPDADIILVRDCFVHLSFEDIQKALINIKNSKIKYILTTTFPRTKRNYNITTGNWRAINFSKPPFSFPSPEKIINEGCTEVYGQYPDKSLGLWKVSSIQKLEL